MKGTLKLFANNPTTPVPHLLIRVPLTNIPEAPENTFINVLLGKVLNSIK